MSAFSLPFGEHEKAFTSRSLRASSRPGPLNLYVPCPPLSLSRSLALHSRENDEGRGGGVRSRAARLCGARGGRAEVPVRVRATPPSHPPPCPVNLVSRNAQGGLRPPRGAAFGGDSRAPGPRERCASVVLLRPDEMTECSLVVEPPYTGGTGRYTPRPRRWRPSPRSIRPCSRTRRASATRSTTS